METINNSAQDIDDISSMWMCFYDEFVNHDPENWFLLIRAAMLENAEISDHAIKANEEFMIGTDKYLYTNNTLVNGVLNTVSVIKIHEESTGVDDTFSPYPEFVSDTILQCKIIKIMPYKSGQAGLLQVKVISGKEQDDDLVITFFDTRFTKNFKKYKVGKKYKFRIGALTIGLIHRAKSDIKYKRDGKFIDTTEDAYIYQKPDIISAQFLGICQFKLRGYENYHDNKPLKHPIITSYNPEAEMYIYDITHKQDGKVKYSIPAIVTDGVMIASSRHKKGRKSKTQNIFKNDTPINMTGVLQGFLAE